MSADWTLTIPQSTSGRRRSFWSVLKTWYIRSRERQALGELDDRLLRDCGITREQVRRELDKPFWSL